MNLLYYTSGFDGCHFYRVGSVCKYLNRLPNVYAKVSSQYSMDEIKKSDIIVIQKQSNQKAIPFLKQAKALGKKIISEVDDDYFHIDPSNPAYKHYYNKAQDLINFYKLSDAITVTTDHLRKELLVYNDNIYVLPNSLDVTFLDKINALKPEEKIKHTKYLSRNQDIIPLEEVTKMLDGKIVLVWGGSPTHLRDLQQATPALQKICEENKNVVLLMMACTTETLIKCISEEQLILVAPTPIFNYHQVLSTMPADIGICPIDDIRFNWSKSNIKFLEFSSNGFPCVCSDVENYKKTVIHGETGLLAKNTNKDWYEKLNILIQDESLRKSMGEKAKKFVRENYDIKNNVNLWLKAYQEILKK